MSTEIRFVAYPSGAVEMPVRVWQCCGFTMMTHPAMGTNTNGMFRVSEGTTGYGIPNSHATTMDEAETKARVCIERNREILPAILAQKPVLNHFPSTPAGASTKQESNHGP